MLSFLQYSDWSFVLEFVARETNNLDKLSSILLNRVELPVTKAKVEQWSDLELKVRSGDGVFGIDSSDFLVDVSDLEINEDNSKYLVSVANDKDVNVFLYSSSRVFGSDDSDSKGKADKDGKSKKSEKDVCKDLGVKMIALKKPDEDVLHNFVVEYNKELGLNLSSDELALIEKRSESYTDAIACLDFLVLTNNPKAVLQDYFEEVELPIYMRSFNLKNLDRDVVKWLDVEEEELQQVLSLIYTKLDKQGGDLSLKAKKNLILTDEKIKTRSKISPTVWWKLFLWSLKQ